MKMSDGQGIALIVEKKQYRNTCREKHAVIAKRANETPLHAFWKQHLIGSEGKRFATKHTPKLWELNAHNQYD